MSSRALWAARTLGGPFAKALASRTVRPRPHPDVAYQKDPIGWLVNVLAIPEHTLRWSKNPGYRDHAWDGTQDPLVKIAEGLAAGRNVGVESATGTGKTYLAAGLVLWFVAAFEDALVVTVAPKEAQLTTQLWKELGPHMTRFTARFPTAEKGELVLRMDAKAKDRDVWVALGWACGIEAGAESTTRAQGFHAAHMLIITEETPGIPAATMNALGLTRVGSHNLQLSLGNPNHRDDPLHKFCEHPGTLHVSPMVTEWDGGGNGKYLKQVRRFIPEGESFPLSRFRRREISRFLAELTDATSEGKKDDKGKPIPPRAASPATKNRYRAALSVFAKWLVEREILETNPVRDVAAQTPRRRSIVFLEPDQVQTLIDGLPNPYRPFEALLAGTGMEYSAAARVRRRDVDLKMRVVFANGEKNEYRTRYVELTEDWAWQIVAAHLKEFSSNAPLFPEISEEAALVQHHRAAKALGLPRTTLHQHRHSFAVMHLRRGCDHQWLKNQLGHAPQSTLLYTTYGLYIQAAKLTERQLARHATSPRNDMGRRRGG